MKKFIIPFLVVFNAACHSSAVFEKYEELPEENWNRYKVIEFMTHIPDSGLYNVTLSIRHTSDYEMANLWCFISTRSHAARQLKDTVNIKIAEPDGRWLGKGGSIKTIEQSINHNPVALPRGDVKFRIEQGMRIENMKGIKNVGIRIEKMTDQEFEKSYGKK